MPEVSFYAVPRIDIFATLSNCGYLATYGEATDLESNATVEIFPFGSGGKVRWTKLRISSGIQLKKTISEEGKIVMGNIMWKCTKCGREFKKTNQDHYCGEKPKTIDEYVLAQDEDKRADLTLMRQIISNAIPEAEERISWSMPTFWKKHNICHFAAFKKHIGFYPGPAAVENFADQLTAYKTDKGTIRIPYGKIDKELVASIAKWCFDTGNHA